MRYLRLAGDLILGSWANILWALHFLWRLLWFAFAAVILIDLFRIPVSVNRSEDFAIERTLWEKMTPEAEKRLAEYQSVCRHIYKHNSHFTYYCPLCRKKLIPGSVPLTGY